jgi:hypothetical protein
MEVQQCFPTIEIVLNILKLIDFWQTEKVWYLKHDKENKLVYNRLHLLVLRC